jgi:hypothetical protein
LNWEGYDVLILQARADDSVTKLSSISAATTRHIEKAASFLRESVQTQTEVVIDVPRTQFIDAGSSDFS